MNKSNYEYGCGSRIARIWQNVVLTKAFTASGTHTGSKKMLFQKGKFVLFACDEIPSKIVQALLRFSCGIKAQGRTRYVCATRLKKKTKRELDDQTEC